MNDDKIHEYISEVPHEIRNMVKPLNNDKTWAILISLIKHDYMRFTELKEDFKTDSPGDINRYLKNLVAAGLVEKRSKIFKDMDNPEKTYYYPTPLCEALLKALFQSIAVPKPEVAKKEGGIGKKPLKLMSDIDYVPKFCSILSLKSDVQYRAMDIIKQANEKELTSGKDPKDVAAAAIYISSILCDKRKTQKEVANAAGVTENTIRNRYKELTDELHIALY